VLVGGDGMSEWREYKLGDFIEVKHGFAFSGNNITDEPTNNILVTPGNFCIGGGFKNSKFKYFNSTFPEDYVLNEGDFVVTMTDLSQETDTLGYSAKIPKQKGVNFLHNQRIGLLQFKSDKVNKDFIYWLLRTRDYHDFIVGSASGTSIMHTSPSRIKEYSFLLPPLPEQRAIAAALSSLDDKIDLLHRQNKTLEAMAETLFRQWFVEDATQTSPRPSPEVRGSKEAYEGWEEKPLTYIANFLNGLACQKYPPKNEIEKLPVLKIRELSNGISESSDWATSNVDKDFIVELGDVIFAWSASLMVKIWDGEKCVLNQHLFKVTSEKYPKWFYFEWCKYYLDKFIVISTSHATTMGHIKRIDLDNAMVLIPSDREIKAMTEIMEPIIEKIITNYHQLIILRKLRDSLLPKLMSGEVKVNFNELKEGDK
jgi:type I restriction enzyme S subunit